MLSVRINRRIYELPLGELYRDRFSEYINDDILELDSVRDYRVYDELFGFIVRSFTMIYGSAEDDSFLSQSDIEQSLNLRRRISSVDNIQKFYIKRGKVDKAISTIREFMIEMLSFDNSIKNDHSNTKRR